MPVDQRGANRVAQWTVGLFAVAIVAVAMIALQIPAKIGASLGEAMGEAGFRVKSVDVTGVQRCQHGFDQIIRSWRPLAAPFLGNVLEQVRHHRPRGKSGRRTRAERIEAIQAATTNKPRNAK